ncbi:hypothetical protein LRU_00066 [Ligilactobacillus ruminis SPM0211]|uniref:Uncharacterized protein n=1 Tax=Ligilactobacillus ruminis SPM0211 TaxID=1040964 RepID=F7QXB3_9LACO|nr:hypothetical protein LRU_00066 [Ligilactobacillus ruminis SPM0211]
MSILFSEINQGIRGLDDSDLAYFSAAFKTPDFMIPLRIMRPAAV